MEKIYKKDGNNNSKSKKYCKFHFIERYNREPNILDTAHIGSCHDFHHCDHRNSLDYICHGLLKLTAKYREDNNGVEEWTCQTCGEIRNFR